MTYYDLLNLLRTCRSADWLADDSRGVYTLKLDLDVTIREVRSDSDSDSDDEEPFQQEPFHEEWATKFPDPVAYRVIFELWYRNSFVKVYPFVSVDGGRALLPYPKAADDLTITAEQMVIADAVNELAYRDYFERYIKRFKVED